MVAFPGVKAERKIGHGWTNLKHDCLQKLAKLIQTPSKLRVGIIFRVRGNSWK